MIGPEHDQPGLHVIRHVGAGLRHRMDAAEAL
jgi:hypothetical protein